MDNVLQIDKQILNSDKIICRHINNLCNSTRGEISQDILSQLRHFVEHILLKIYANGNDIEDTQDNVKQAVKYAKNQEWLRYLSRFHHFLQVSVSHRTLEEENSERLMLKYYEYLLRIKTMLHDKYSLDVLYNLEQFPIETDESLNEYYLKIVQKVDEYKKSSKNMYKYDRFYIQNIKPFFCNNKIYYEVAFIPANDKASKTDRIIAFTDREITDFYAVKLAIEDDYIEIFDKCMPIRIILDWEVSIRPCEFKNFSKIINNQTNPIGKAEERELVKYLTESGRSLAEIVVYSDEKYNEIRNRIVPNREGYHFFDLLDFCRQLIKNQGAGYNVLRYLLHHMNNRVIKEQYHESYKKNYNTGRWEYLGANNWLSNLYLANECLPFDTMPFCSGLRKYVPNEEVIAAAKLAHCDEFADKLPEGWHTMIGENGSGLSGGERQRISIARAFLKDAPIIFLDEATASLDVDNETLIQEALSRLIQDKTVMIIAHRMRTVADADKIVVLKDGVVAEEGAPAELAAKDGIYQHMAKTQLQVAGWKL